VCVCVCVYVCVCVCVCVKWRFGDRVYLIFVYEYSDIVFTASD
jgi:hypothetical protein